MVIFDHSWNFFGDFWQFLAMLRNLANFWRFFCNFFLAIFADFREFVEILGNLRQSPDCRMCRELPALFPRRWVYSFVKSPKPLGRFTIHGAVSLRQLTQAGRLRVGDFVAM